MTYRIRNWDRFETYETRKLKHLQWVPTPNKHDGLGFRRLAAMENSCELFAAWNLILQVASKAGPKERGTLARDGQALTAQDLELMTGFKARIFEQAFLFFSRPDMGWLESSPALTGEHPAEAGASVGESPAEGRKEGMEGREEATAGKDPLAPEIPSEAEVVAWGAGGAGIPADFCRHYHQSTEIKNRWVSGGRLINWKMQCKQWWESDKGNGKWKPKATPNISKNVVVFDRASLMKDIA